MKRNILGLLGISVLAGTVIAFESKRAAAQVIDSPATNWPQWGQNAQHEGFVTSVSQMPLVQLADIVFDPFVLNPDRSQGPELQFYGGELLVHYQAPLIHENDVYMMFETGNPATFPDGRTWHEKRLHWEGNPAELVTKWDFATDWQPVPIDFSGWEQVFHAALADGLVYVPGANGSVFQLDAGSGEQLARFSPLGSDPNTFVASPITVDSSGNIFYNAIKLDPNTLLTVHSWLVKVTPDGNSLAARYEDLLAPANPPTTCSRAFNNSTLPWPPSPTAQPSAGACGIQRVGLNVTPAIAPDGTIYSVSRADLNSRYSYLVAVNPNLTLKWAASLRDRYRDGCGFTIPIATSNTLQKGTCRFATPPNGVDPQTNQPPAGRVIDQSSSSPTVLPDGSVIYGAYSRYNVSRGHLIRFAANGNFISYYDFGWDSTPAVFRHDGTFSFVIKDNHYDEEEGFYCNNFQGNPAVANIVCAFTGIPAGPFYISQLSSTQTTMLNGRPKMVAEWSFHSTETNSCLRHPDGSITCTSDHPNGFEWCVNGDAVDGNGTVIALSEDGNLYSIPQGHTGVFDMSQPDVHRLFTNLALAAAYTPSTISPNGLIYTENGGDLLVVGASGSPHGNPGGLTTPRGGGNGNFRDDTDPTD